MEKIRLIVISEDFSSRKGLSAIFTEDVFEVLSCIPLDEAVERSVLLQPDVALVVIGDNDITKYEQIIKEIKQECPCSLIIAIMENEQFDKVADIMAQGADSCIPKGITRSCLVRCVELAYGAGVFCFPGAVKKKFAINSSANTLYAAKFTDDFDNSVLLNGGALTKREMEILNLMALNYSNQDIAQKLFISEPTVKTHVSSILRNLGKNNRAQAVLYSYKVGLVSNPMVIQKK